MKSEILLRSLFFIPGNVEKYLKKAGVMPVDAVILDVEDSVPPHEKPAARKLIGHYLRSGYFKDKQIIIRINILEEGMLLDDLHNVLHPDVLALMPAKIYSQADLDFFNRILFQFECDMGLSAGCFKLLPLIETLDAVENAHSIAKASDRLIGLAFGGEDYLRELGGTHGNDDHTFDYPRTKIAVAAKAAQIQAIDTPYLDVHDSEGFIARERKSKDLGYDGCLLIHPNQIEPTHECFSPNAEEVAQAQTIFDAVHDAKSKGLSVALLNGTLIGPPMQKKAEKILIKHTLIQQKQGLLRDELLGLNRI